MCECYQIGGRFIAEDLYCGTHNLIAQIERKQRYSVISKLEEQKSSSYTYIIRLVSIEALAYIKGLE